MTNATKQIVIATYGWVVMGETTVDDGWTTVQQGSVLRVWGTTEGLGEIATKGLQPRTTAEPIGELLLPESAVIARIKCEPRRKPQPIKDKRIVIATYGWVFMGDYEIDRQKRTVTLTQSDTIRLWGTTKGLGEIALYGPTSSTILDFTGTIELPIVNVIGVMKCVK